MDLRYQRYKDHEEARNLKQKVPGVFCTDTKIDE